MKRYRIRMVEFAGAEEFPQGLGMTWDSVVVEHEFGERIVQMEAAYRGGSFNHLIPIVRAWISYPEDPDVCPDCGDTAHPAGCLGPKRRVA